MERIDSKMDRMLSFFEETAAPRTKVPRMDSHPPDEEARSSFHQVIPNATGTTRKN
jgi:hypothetical protein